MPPVLRLYEDVLANDAELSLPASPRLIFVVHGSVTKADRDLPLAGDDGVRAAHPTFSRRGKWPAGVGGWGAGRTTAPPTSRNATSGRPPVSALPGPQQRHARRDIQTGHPVVLGAPDDPATADLARIEGRLAGGAGFD